MINIWIHIVNIGIVLWLIESFDYRFSYNYTAHYTLHILYIKIILVPILTIKDY